MVKITKGFKINLGNYEQESIEVTMEGEDPTVVMNTVNTILYEEHNRIRDMKATEAKIDEPKFASTKDTRKSRLFLAESEINNCKTLKELQSSEMNKFITKVKNGLKDQNLVDQLAATYKMKVDELGGDSGAEK